MNFFNQLINLEISENLNTISVFAKNTLCVTNVPDLTMVINVTQPKKTTQSLVRLIWSLVKSTWPVPMRTTYADRLYASVTKCWLRVLSESTRNGMSSIISTRADLTDIKTVNCLSLFMIGASRISAVVPTHIGFYSQDQDWAFCDFWNKNCFSQNLQNI